MWNKSSGDRKLSSLKVLAVDDSTAILDAIKEVLTSIGHEVETADNGAQALDKHNKFRPDVITLDLAMPVMDGEETLRRILKLDPNARIIMLTASEHKELIQKCLHDGAVGFIVKPFTSKELIDTVTNVVSIGYDKNSNSFFTMVCSKIEAGVKKTLGNDVSVSLKSTNTINLRTNNIFFNPNNKEPSQVNTVPDKGYKMEIPVDAIGYVSEFKGRDGVVISFIDDEDLGKLFGAERVRGRDLDSETLGVALELFNIINQKVISEVVNTTHIEVKPEPARLYYKSRDKFTFKDEVIVAKWEITSCEHTIPIETRFGFTC